MDPIDLRDRIDENPVRRVERQVVRESALWKSRNPRPNADPGPIKRERRRLAQSVWYRHLSMDSAAEVRVHKDSSVEVLSAVQDIGGGIKTVLAQILAEQFGVPPAKISVKIGDTNYPVGPNSGGSVTTASIHSRRARRGMAGRTGNSSRASPRRSEPRASDLTLSGGMVRSASGKFTPIPFRIAAAKMNTSEVSAQAKRLPDYDPSHYDTYGGVDIAEVTIDIEIGRIQVKRYLAVHDCGRPINPGHVTSQINGGVIQGISYSLFEHRLLDPNHGLMVNTDLDRYKIAGSYEVPQIEVQLVESYIGQSSTDASGIGEAAGIISAGAAIGNAVYNATGIRVRQLPMTPAVVLAALNQPQPSMESL